MPCNDGQVWLRIIANAECFWELKETNFIIKRPQQDKYLRQMGWREAPNATFYELKEFFNMNISYAVHEIISLKLYYESWKLLFNYQTIENIDYIFFHWF